MSAVNKLVAGAAFAAALVAGAAVPLGGAQAAPVLLNGSFEDGINPGSYTTIYSVDNTSITGWSVDAGSIDYIGTYWQPGQGERSIDMNGFSTPGTISQTVTGLISGHTYQVSFEIAGNPDGLPTIKTLGVTAAADGNSYTFDVTGKSLGAMGWETKFFTFTATDITALLSFASLSGGDNAFFGPALDNVTIDDLSRSIDQTPLPAALPLFASGLGAFGYVGWRRKRKNAAALAAA